MLSVPTELLKTQGSVNAEVARLLVEGALARSPADIALAITGVLGPEPDEDGNPVGLVFFAYGKRGGPIEILEQHLPPEGHERLMRRAVDIALSCVERAVAIP